MSSSAVSMSIGAMTPRQRFEADLERDDFIHDPAQEAAVTRLQRLHDELLSTPEPPQGGLAGLLGRLKNTGIGPPRGLYLWGNVGRGKTYLMDLFHESLPVERKLRLHFHRFMHKVHAELKTLKGRRDPLMIVAERFADQAQVLCFDEFYVSDVGDAVILAELLKGLFERGTALVATSNIPPRELYKNGLQRVKFLPAIGLIEEYTEVLEIDGGVDYRLAYLDKAKVYHTPLGEDTERMLAEQFRHFAPGARDEDKALEIEGRSLAVKRCGDGIVWFEFDVLCGGPRSQVDYIEIARSFNTVLLSNIPVMSARHDDKARRFISLIDEFYDRKVRLIATAEAMPKGLYTGERLIKEFERTASRLEEMQSHDYLALSHLS